MTQRTYNQYCSLARALDLIGERWTLLILRDLLVRPRRYKELLEGLPGIGTNLLAARLKELARLEFVERVPLEDGRTSAYSLTEAGHGIEDALIALARFGVQRLGARDPGESWQPGWSTLALKASFRPDRARGVRARYEFRVDDEVFHARVRGSRLETGAGSVRDPDLVLVAGAEAFLRLASGQVTPKQAFSDPGFEIEGDLAALQQCQALFGLPAE